MQYHLAAKRTHRINLDLRRGDRHDDHGPRAQLARAQRHALRMIARRRADHAFFQLRRAQMSHLVVSPAQLEAEHRLLVFALEQHRVPQPLAEIARFFKRRLASHVVHPRRQNFFQVVGRLQFVATLARAAAGLGSWGHGEQAKGSMIRG